MTVRISKSNLAEELERALDDNEQYIGSAVWQVLSKVYEKIDEDARDMEDDLDDQRKRIEELEAKIAELEDDR